MGGSVGEMDAEALAAHYGPDGPVAAAQRWLDALFYVGDYAAAWALMDDRLQLARAQAWVWSNRTHPALAGRTLDELAAGLVAESDPLWLSFAAIELRTFRDAYKPAEVGYPDGVGAASTRRPIGENLELVLYLQLDKVEEAGAFVDPEFDVPVVFEPTPVLPWVTLTMIHSAGGWRVASNNPTLPDDPGLPEPGWPPRM